MHTVELVYRRGLGSVNPELYTCVVHQNKVKRAFFMFSIKHTYIVFFVLSAGLTYMLRLKNAGLLSSFSWINCTPFRDHVVPSLMFMRGQPPVEILNFIKALIAHSKGINLHRNRILSLFSFGTLISPKKLAYYHVSFSNRRCEKSP